MNVEFQPFYLNNVKSSVKNVVLRLLIVLNVLKELTEVTKISNVNAYKGIMIIKENQKIVKNVHNFAKIGNSFLIFTFKNLHFLTY